MHRALQLLRKAPFAAPSGTEAAIARVRGESGIDFGRARARAGFGRGHLLEVVIYLPGGVGGAREAQAAEDLVRRLVGEELFERWIGSTAVTPAVRGGPLAVLNSNAEDRTAFPIAALLDSVRAAVAGLKLGLPEFGFESNPDAEDWVAFELEPEPACDYAAQDDLVFCSTRVPELKKCFLRGEPFYSGRFSNSSALFAYLKYEASERSPAARLAERGRIEALIKGYFAESEGNGGLVGVGLGVRYGYIDVALRDPDGVVDRLLPALRAGELPKASWLLFCDSELEHEFLPVYLDARAPFQGRAAGR